MTKSILLTISSYESDLILYCCVYDLKRRVNSPNAHTAKLLRFEIRSNDQYVNTHKIFSAVRRISVDAVIWYESRIMIMEVPFNAA